MHFTGGVRRLIVVVVAFLSIASNLCFVKIEASAAKGALTEEQVEFVEKYYDICLADAVDYNLAWQTPMAQAIVESQSGTSKLSVRWHNFHGITSSKGGYKHFQTDEEGWVGYFENLQNTPVYTENKVFETGDDPYKMLDALVASGYAEAEDYKKVIGIYIGFIEDWRKANDLPTSAEEAEREEIEAEKHSKDYDAVTLLASTGGCANFTQMLYEIPVGVPEEENKYNDHKSRRGDSFVAPFFMLK